MKIFVKYWLPVIFVAVVIFIVSSIQEPPISVEIPHVDKGVHFAEYAVLGFLLKRAFIRDRVNQRIGLSLWAIAVATLYGAVNEFYQSFVPNREISGLDLLFDGLGAVLGTIFYVDRKKVFKYNRS